jgi:uncharacterized protein YqjF (DUF2071 family)
MAQKILGCTVVSIVPFKINEQKPGLIPGIFTIEASDGKNPQVLVVQDARHNVYIDLLVEVWVLGMLLMKLLDLLLKIF